VIARAGHPRLVARASRIALSSERHAEVHVAFGKPSQELERAYQNLGIKRQIAVIVPTFSAAAAVVATTDLVAAVPESVVNTLGAALGLRTLVTPLRVPRTPMYMSWHQRTHSDPALSLFRQLIAEEMAAR
jgi:DNA-binding transcriptional LysR family regulator